MARWIRLSDKFAYIVPGDRSMVEWPLGDWFMNDDQADAAVKSGIGSEIPKPKGKRANAAGQVVETEPGDAD